MKLDLSCGSMRDISEMGTLRNIARNTILERFGTKEDMAVDMLRSSYDDDVCQAGLLRNILGHTLDGITRKYEESISLCMIFKHCLQHEVEPCYARHEDYPTSIVKYEGYM